MLSWDEICKRAEEKNKTVICEVEKKRGLRSFKIKCNICQNESIINSEKLSRQCIICLKSQEPDRNILLSDFLIKAKKIHGNKYDYDFVIYHNNNTKIDIKCNSCKNIFSQKPIGHLAGYGCRKCAHAKIRSTKEDFVLKAKKIHNEKFCYDFVEYVNSLTKVEIFCNQCKIIFLQRPTDHLKGYGCKICADRVLKSNTEEFILKAKKIHGNKYNYDLVDYIKSTNKINIICNHCNNIFSSTPVNHLRSGSKCSICYKSERLNTEKWIQRVKEIHGDKFDYNLVEYIASDKKVIIKCNKCNNLFSQVPYHHADGKGCPVCKESKGESKIAKYLKKKNINFDREKIFEGLFYKRCLRYDFHLTALNLLIEFDGEGHYEACFGKTVEEKQVNLEDCQRRDKIKNEWAKANNIPLLRIPYWDFDRIEELIDAFIIKHTKKEIKQLVMEI